MDTGSTEALLEWDVREQAIVTVCGRNLLSSQYTGPYVS